jgi:hypothetical protein
MSNSAPPHSSPCCFYVTAKHRKRLLFQFRRVLGTQSFTLYGVLCDFAKSTGYTVVSQSKLLEVFPMRTCKRSHAPGVKT